MAGVIVTTHHALPKLPAAITLYTLQNTGLASHNGVAADFSVPGGGKTATTLAYYEYAKSLPGIKVVGIDIHIGSQITELEPFDLAFEKVVLLYNQLKIAGHNIINNRFQRS